MKAREQVLAEVAAGRKSRCLDGRDYGRLLPYFEQQHWPIFGFEPIEATEARSLEAWSRENILRDLKRDLAFGFQKALDKRGISSSLMWGTLQTWLWVLDDPLQHCEEYAQYGLPLFRAVAVAYGFPNPIGNDAGTEAKYSMGGEGGHDGED